MVAVYFVLGVISPGKQHQRVVATWHDFLFPPGRQSDHHTVGAAALKENYKEGSAADAKRR